MDEKTMYFQVELTEEQWLIIHKMIHPFRASSPVAQNIYTNLGEAKIVWK